MSKGKKAGTIISIILVLLLFGQTGCDAGGVFSGGSGEDRYRMEQTVYLPMEKVRTLNPMISKDEDTYYISKLLYDSLFELDEYFRPEKKLVDSYSYSDDQLKLSIDLKQGVKWHDGEEFTASDVKFSIDTYINLSNSNETLYASYVSNIRAASITRGEPYKITISFRNSRNVGLENLVFPILPSHQFSRASDVRRNTEDFIPIGTGPYKVESYNNLSRLTLTASEYYHGRAPNNQLVFIIFPDKKDAINLVDVGTISLLINDEEDRDTLISNMNVKTVNFISNQAEFVAFNMNRGIMKNDKVRKAVCHAINSREILETAYLKSGVLSDTIFYPYYFGNRNEDELYAYDIEIAAGFLSESDLTDMEPVCIIVNSDDQSRVAATNIIKNALDKIQLDSYIIYCSWDEYLTRIAFGEFDMYVGGYSFNERYDLRDLLHSEYGNAIGYSNPRLDELLDEMRTGIDNGRKADVFFEVNSILKDEVPYYCILYKTYGAISSASLKGEINPLFNDFYRNCGEWVCEYKIPAVVAE